jgi:hypothetical protein
VLRLILREIHDHSVHIGVCCVLSAIAVTILIGMIVYGVVGGGIAGVSVMGALLFLGFAILGVAQMYGDRANRISTLLATQAATRNRILVARIVTGILAVLITMVPAIALGVILLRLRVPPLEFYSRMVWDISAVAILTGLACHGMGLLIGWTTNRAWLIVAFVGLLTLLPALVVVKGFGPAAMAFLGLLILAAWARIWHTFTSMSL